MLLLYKYTYIISFIINDISLIMVDIGNDVIKIDDFFFLSLLLQYYYTKSSRMGPICYNDLKYYARTTRMYSSKLFIRVYYMKCHNISIACSCIFYFYFFFQNFRNSFGIKFVKWSFQNSHTAFVFRDKSSFVREKISP